MQFTTILLSIALFAGAASAADYDEARAEARAAVRSLLEEYEELQTRTLCTVTGEKCTGQVKKACTVLCFGAPCAWNTSFPGKEVLEICKKACRCGGNASTPGMGIGIKA
jgi:hypothetical protein